ncbi:MAG: hypothetical protein MUO77_07225, partial [Anaerolineales bacterium]|nr:hypothetical protein [Anaerolineales bacterium]
MRDWRSIRGRLQQETRPPETLTRILRAMEAPLHWNQLTPPVSEERSKFAFMHASLMRKRSTLGDLLIFSLDGIARSYGIISGIDSSS